MRETLLTRKLLGLALALTMIFIGAGVFLTPPSDLQVRLNVDGLRQALTVQAGFTVGDLLRSKAIPTEDALIAPPSSTPLQDGSAVAVVYKKDLQVVLNGEEQTVTTIAPTLRDAVADLHPLILSPETYSSLPLATAIPREGLPDPVVISTPKIAHVIVNGQTRTVLTSAPTVNALLEDANVTLTDRDRVTRSGDRYVELGMRIGVTQVRTREVVRTQRRVLPVVTRWTSSMLRGEQEVLKKPSPRVLRVTYRLTLVGGEVRDRKTLKTQVLKPGQAKVILRGLAVPYPEVDPESAKAYAIEAMSAYGWDGRQFQCLDLLWTRESGWRYDADNPTSSAYGIPQALTELHTLPEGYMTDFEVQVDWGLAYLKSRYGAEAGPCSAWAHSERLGWY